MKKLLLLFSFIMFSSATNFFAQGLSMIDRNESNIFVNNYNSRIVGEISNNVINSNNLNISNFQKLLSKNLKKQNNIDVIYLKYEIKK